MDRTAISRCGPIECQGKAHRKLLSIRNQNAGAIFGNVEYRATDARRCMVGRYAAGFERERPRMLSTISYGMFHDLVPFVAGLERNRTPIEVPDRHTTEQ